MSNILYRQFYREQGARYPDALTRQPDFKLTKLPREAVMHVYDDGDGAPTIDATKPYFQGYSRKIIAEHVYHIGNPQGPVREWAFNFTMSVQPWKVSHLKTWQLEDDVTKVRMAPDQLAVINYGFLDKAYKYQPIAMAPYYKWLNRMTTIYETMDRLASGTGRQQFIIIKIPQVLHGRTVLDKFADKDFSLTMFNIIATPDVEGLMLLDLWRWIGIANRKRSLLNLIQQKNYDKINFVFEGVTGKQLLINLGYLNSWIKGQPNSTEFSNIVQFAEVNVQKLFLKLCISLNGLQEETEETPQATTPVVTPTAENNDEELAEIPSEKAYVEPEQTSLHQATAADLGKALAAAEKDPKPIARPEKIGAELMDEIEADLEALDRISLTQVKNKGLTSSLSAPSSKIAEDVRKEVAGQIIPEPTVSQEEARALIFTPSSPAKTLQKKLAEDAEASLINAAEYRRMTEAVKVFNESEDPYGSGLPRNQASVITSEDTTLTQSDSEIVVSEAVPDRSMAKSSLNQFNKKYLRHVYKKDVLNAVNRLQAAGVIVKKHEVHQTTTILGSYEHHRLELKPIDGQPSTIKFSLPVVAEDGTFEVGGNKYLARKVRRDVPIRKIAPSIVGLSTYYGKSFVQISPKVVNNSTAWIVKQINLAIITEGSYINSISLGNVFDNEFKAAFIYNALAVEFESFSAGKHQLFFDHRQRKAKIDEKLLASIEKNSRVFCGISANKKPIVVTNQNHFLEIDGDKEVHLGDIYQLLKLDKTAAPVDFSEVRVFSKYIPVGVVLGYYIGFKALLAALGAEYRIIEPRKNKMLEAGEYPIIFKDKTYVFKSDRRFESLILAGFGDYDKVTKLYDSEMFENKDVYLNLMMSKGFSALYVRELDMMEHAFIDHISEEILLSMGEPTTFKGLLYRATEMLLTYHHPVSQDRTVMRDCGYERFSGAVYKELSQAIRQFRNKNLIGRSKIDISPYQVLNAVMKDSSIKIVEDINPIQNLKESEVVTYSGTGGRDKDTMTKPTRAFHVSDVGVLSESTVDNAGVGTVAYLAANPNLANVRGMLPEKKELTPTNMMSTASLVSPCSFTDNQLFY